MLTASSREHIALAGRLGSGPAHGPNTRDAIAANPDWLTEMDVAPLQRLCASAELEERGKAVSFDVIQWREPVRAFALRFDGQAVAYLNRCAHVPTEMDWQEGEFLDSDKRFIMCSIHGAVYDPLTGQCLMGPCNRGRLTKIEVTERDGEVFWHPTRDTKPVFED